MKNFPTASVLQVYIHCSSSFTHFPKSVVIFILFQTAIFWLWRSGAVTALLVTQTLQSLQLQSVSICLFVGIGRTESMLAVFSSTTLVVSSNPFGPKMTIISAFHVSPSISPHCSMSRSRALAAVTVLSAMCAASIVPAPTSLASTLVLLLPCSYVVYFFCHIMSEVAWPIAVIFCTMIGKTKRHAESTVSLLRWFRPQASIAFSCFIYLVYSYGRPKRSHYRAWYSPVFVRYYTWLLSVVVCCPLDGCIVAKQCKIGHRLLLITNRKLSTILSSNSNCVFRSFVLHCTNVGFLVVYWVMALFPRELLEYSKIFILVPWFNLENLCRWLVKNCWNGNAQHVS